MILKLKNVHKYYYEENSAVKAVDGISIDFPDKGLHFIVGRSGCGKTTLLKVMSSLCDCTDGEIFYDDTNICYLNDKEKLELRNIEIGYIFQEYNLISELNVFDNITLALDIQETDSDCKSAVSQMLSYVGLEGYEKRNINQLSGGERQRVAIARALIKKPRIIFADEPTGNLDSKTEIQILELFKKISLNKLVIIVSHNIASANIYGDRIINICDGKIDSIEHCFKSNSRYSLIIEDENGKREYNNISYSQCIRQISSETHITPYTTSKKVAFKIDKISSFAEEKSIPKACSDQKAIAKTLSFRKTLRIGLNLIQKRKLKFVLSALIFSVSIFLFTIANHLLVYNINLPVENYFNLYNYNFFVPYYDCEYEDVIGNRYQNTIYNGKEIFDWAGNASSSFAWLLKNQLIQSSDDMEGYYSAHECTEMYCSDFSDSGLTLFSGKFPERDCETAITDYLAYKLGVTVGDNIYRQEKAYSVCGIIKTEYIEYEWEQQCAMGGYGNFFMFNKDYVYNLILLSDECIKSETEGKNQLELRAADIISGENIRTFASSSALLSVPSDDYQLISGRLPENNNEVLISIQYVRRYNPAAQPKSTYSIPDLGSEKYNGYYDNVINLAAYFNGKAEVVGVIDANPDEVYCPDIIVSQEIFNQIMQDYYRYCYFDGCMLFKGEKTYGEIIKSFNSRCFNFDEPNIYALSQLENMIHSVQPLIIFSAGVLLFLSLLIFLSMISSTFKDNIKNISVFSSLGVTKKDIVGIFSIEFIFVIVSTILLSVGFDYAGANLINRLYEASLFERLHPCFCIYIPVIAVSFITVFIFGIILSSIPIYKLLSRYSNGC